MDASVSLPDAYTAITDADTDATTGSGDGVQADTLIVIDGPALNVKTGPMMVAYSSGLISSGDYVADDFKYASSGDGYAKVDSEQRGRSGTYAIVNSCKGLRVGMIDYEENDGTTTTKSGGAIILSSPNIKTGETCTLKSGSTTVGSVTVSSTISTIGNVSQGPGQGGEPGGGQGGPGGRH